MTARDKHDHPIQPGDTVDAVHAGEHHTFTVAHVSEEHGHHYLHGAITIKVPAAATIRRYGPRPTVESEPEAPATAPARTTKPGHKRG